MYNLSTEFGDVKRLYTRLLSKASWILTDGFSSNGMTPDALGTQIGGLVPAVLSNAVVNGVHVDVLILTVIVSDVVVSTLAL